MLWLPKDPKIKKGKFLFPWTGLFRIKKTFSNNIVQLNTLSNEDITLINVNKLKAYQNPIITIAATTIMTQYENQILLNEILRRIIGRRRIHFYEVISSMNVEVKHNIIKTMVAKLL